MKSTLFTTIFILFVACISNAQIIPGTQVVGGGINFSYSDTPSNTQKFRASFFSFTPSIGKFISEIYQLESGIGYAKQSQITETNSNNFNKFNIHSFSIRFGATRFIDISDRLYLTIGGSFAPGYSQSRTSYKTNGNEVNSSTREFSVSASIVPGLTYFVSEKWMLFANIGFINYRVTLKNGSNLTGHDLNLGLSANSFGIGARYILGRQ